ncbi:Filament-like plant protein 4 [Camellia lanceoleosa]|uniref:Filament-like plant protein 4 n=1 Tax=Camellia lanceoleosa TaxID=1840588 RepID=A0ACC0IXZ6_9ERIC|nr:Filament-like plant protein 4 [Camellia lanceoleosa]
MGIFSEIERRSWPWKKKSSDKTGTEKMADAANSAGASLASVGSLRDQENCKKFNYVQIPLESYTHLTGLEDQVIALEDQVKMWQNQVKDLKEKLSAANLEMTAKDNLVKQHAKVAEEAVSGWEKADSEASALKHQLESVTLLKLTAEDRASHLDGALKECMRQIRIVKEEHEHNLHEVVLIKTKQCDKIKLDLEAKLTDLNQRLLRSAAENDALSRSLQEHSSMLMKINEEKSQTEVENELRKKEFNHMKRRSIKLKYELHVLSKELDIRNEEKNMSVRSAEAANKQHLESVKKIAKLEAECQRLRGLVRKKLPGPAALAQMKQEVEIWGHDFGEPRSVAQRSSVKNSKSHLSALPEFSTDNLRLNHKETEFLTKRLLAMEEETKMLKEALAGTVNYSLQETQYDKRTDKGNLPVNANPLELMEDFLEMEKMAHSENISDKISISSSSNYMRTETASYDVSVDAAKHEEPLQSKIQSARNPSTYQVSFNMKGSGKGLEPDIDQFLPSKLLSRISVVLESQSEDTDMRKVLEDVKYAMQDKKNSLAWHSLNSFAKEFHPDDVSNSLQACPQDIEDTIKNEILLTKCVKLGTDTQHVSNQDLVNAVSHIHQFVLSLGGNLMLVHDSSTIGNGFIKDYEDFSASVDKFLLNKISLIDLVFDLSRILVQASELKFIGVGCDAQEGEITCSDRQSFPDGCSHISHSNSNPEVLMEGNLSPVLALNVTSCKCSLELEQLKSEKDRMAIELARCSQDFESTKMQLEEMVPLLAELRSELASSKKLNSLAETQLKCMAESYKSLENRAQKLEENVKILQTETESLDTMLQEEKRSHQDALARCKDLEDRMHRKKSCSICSSPTADYDIKRKQEREIAVAAAKLAECQETIYLLGRQLKAIHPQTDTMEPHYMETLQMGENSVKHKPSFRNPQGSIGHSHEFDQVEINRASSFDMRGTFEEPPMHNYDSSSSPSSGELSQKANNSSSASALALAKHRLRKN